MKILYITLCVIAIVLIILATILYSNYKSNGVYYTSRKKARIEFIIGLIYFAGLTIGYFAIAIIIQKNI